MNGDIRIRIDPMKNAILPACFPQGSIRIHIVAHRAYPQGAARVRARVVEPDGRPSCKAIDRSVANAGGGLPQNDAGAEHNRQYIIAVRQSQRGDRLIEKPGADTLVGQREAMYQKAINVGPIDRGMRRVPDRALAAAIASGRNANWQRGDRV